MRPTYATIPINRIKPNPNNSRTHSKKQIAQIAASMDRFTFTNPILVDEHNVLIAGHGRLEAAKSRKMKSVPAMVIKGLSEAEKRALMLADNRIAQNAGWDREKVVAEIVAIDEEGIDVSVTGFDPAEIDAFFADFEDASGDPADDVDVGSLDGPSITILHDLWLLGKHKLLCGDAREPDDVNRLLGEERADMAFHDPPYNQEVASVVGRGKRKHREFAMASGEMDPEAFFAFLCVTLGIAARVSKEGAVTFVCMDWRHVEELMRAGRVVYGAMLNLIVWAKTNAGQGSFYRSQHELVAAFRVGAAPHLNTIELGRHGRSRSNLWTYAGANTFRKGRMEDLRAHPTVKPVSMIADAMKDCTRRGGIVLDSFCGSGATLLAAERVGRQGRGLEIDPAYVDLAIRRWQSFTGRDAVHATTGMTFEEMRAGRVDAEVPSGGSPTAKGSRANTRRARASS